MMCLKEPSLKNVLIVGLVIVAVLSAVGEATKKKNS